jgi:hypothetical protein
MHPLRIAIVGLIAAALAPACILSDHCPEVEAVAQDWWGDVIAREVSLEADSGTLPGTMFRPKDVETYPGQRPVVVVNAGVNQNECRNWWTAWTVASRGYVTLIYTPTEAGTQYPDMVDALDFVESPDNPMAAFTDASRIGLVGYSSSAPVVELLQHDDPRPDAIIVYDNLTKVTWGDPGASGACVLQDFGVVVTPRVPALGVAQDSVCDANPDLDYPELKLTGFEHWRAAGVPTVELVFDGMVHSDLESVGHRPLEVVDANHQRVFWVVMAWLDRYVAGDPDALDRFEATQWNGTDRVPQLSDQFTSAISTPEYTCLDLRIC